MGGERLVTMAAEIDIVDIKAYTLGGSRKSIFYAQHSVVLFALQDDQRIKDPAKFTLNYGHAHLLCPFSV